MVNDLGHDSNDTRESRFTPEGIPFARPVTPPLEPVDPPLERAAPEHRHQLFLDGTSKRSIWLDLGIALLALVVIEFASQVALAYATGISDLPDDISDAEIAKVLLVPVLPARAMWVTIVLSALLFLRRQSLSSIGLTSSRLGIDVLFGLGTVLVAYGVMIPLGILSQIVDPSISEQLEENAEAIMSMVPRHSPVFFLWLALVIGFYEELLFRGFLMTRLRRVMSSWKWAVVVSTAVFVVPHLLDQTLISAVPITVLSVIFSVVTIWRRSILPAVIGHWLFNLSQFLALYYTVGETWV